MWPEEPNISLSQLATSVLELSDHYINNPDQETPWQKVFCQQAYRYYFLPLNYARVKNVIDRGQQVGFFKDLEVFIDWGAGPGTASLAIADHEQLKLQTKKQILIDHSEIALKKFSDLHSKLTQPQTSTKTDLKNYLNDKDKACLIFSYSITELSELPKDWQKFEALMILEPSTSDDGRKLLQLREQLQQAGFSIWAPCTHQDKCPLLYQSKTDWCHDRIHIQPPDWFTKLEALLPIKNKTITTSYLLARKTGAPPAIKNFARLTGDSLLEKGKTRQLVCRGEKREFLAWMHKNKTVQTLQRGDLVQLPPDLEQKSNELRITETPIKNITHNI